MSRSYCANSQEILAKDTIYVNDFSMEDIGKYSSADSIFTDLKNKKVHLYSNAKVAYGDVSMTAGYIQIDLEKNEVLATYLIDSLGNKLGKPEFDDGAEHMTASSIRYNFNTEKGYIQEMMTQQEENYLYMGVAKRQANEEIHFLKGRFTTCDLEDPHFHFQLSKAILIPDKRIVSGPMNLWIKGVPTFLALPFIILPQQKDKLTGFIFPQVIPSSAYGFGFSQLGYFIPINDKIQTTVYGSLYSRGSYGFSNSTDYYVKYKFKGNFNLGYERYLNGFPSNTSKTNVKIIWSHQKDSKSNPNLQFRSNVNFQSINNPQINLDPNNNNYLNNTFNSDIALDKTFANLPIRTGIKITARQSSVNKSIELNSPTVNFNMTQIFPLKKLVNGTQGWRQIIARFGVTYDMEGKNQSSFADSLMKQADFTRIGQAYKNGVSQRATAKTTVGLFKNTLKINPSITYRNDINFQTVEKFNDSTDTTGVMQYSIRNDLQKITGMAQFFDVKVNATTVLYSYYKFAGKRKSLLRHVMTPTIGYSYIPNLNSTRTLNVINQIKPLSYSQFEQSVYSSGATNDQSLITFAMNNTFELKRQSDKDTVTGFRKIKIIDNLSISGNYDLLKDSMKLSDFNWNLRISPFKFLNFQASGVYSAYNWNDSTGAKTKDFAIDSRSKLGRFLSSTFSTGLTLAPKESLNKIQDTKQKMEDNWNADYQYFILHPEQMITFDIPWKATISHNVSWNINQNKTSVNRDKSSLVQTIRLDGDISFTKRWKLAGSSSFDFKTAKVTYVQMNLVRNMHCWQLSFNWTPVAAYKSFSFQMNAKSSLFQDAKLRFQKPPFFL
ncbi:MAG: putative LPS assembly protein LptD [Crocinitomicaceae bacterium]